MKETFLVVGSGGTGGYFIKNLIHYLNTLSQSNEYHVLMVDGDIVESKNLLRQAFYSHDIGKYKAQVFKDRFDVEGVLNENVHIDCFNGFIHSPLNLVELLSKEPYNDSDVINLVSCVDNNMARLRLTVGQYLLRDVFQKEIRFLDSGNSLWNGQAITSSLKSNVTYLRGLYETLISESPKDFLNFKVQKNSKLNFLYSQFSENDDWINSLTKGEHELSCDEVTVSNPQNIATNQTAGMILMVALDLASSNQYVGEIKFDSATTSIYEVEGTRENRVENNYEERISEILDFIQTKEGFQEVFNTTLNVDFEDIVKEPLNVPVADLDEEMAQTMENDIEADTEPLNTVKDGTDESSLILNSKEVESLVLNVDSILEIENKSLIKNENDVDDLLMSLFK